MTGWGPDGLKTSGDPRVLADCLVQRVKNDDAFLGGILDFADLKEQRTVPAKGDGREDAVPSYMLLSRRLVAPPRAAALAAMLDCKRVVVAGFNSVPTDIGNYTSR